MSEDELEKTDQLGDKTLQALLDLGFVSEPTLVTVGGLELRLQRFEGEGINQFIDRVYELPEPADR